VAEAADCNGGPYVQKHYYHYPTICYFRASQTDLFQKAGTAESQEAKEHWDEIHKLGPGQGKEAKKRMVLNAWSVLKQKNNKQILASMCLNEKDNVTVFQDQRSILWLHVFQFDSGDHKQEHACS